MNYRESPPERGTLFRLEVYTRVGISELKYRKGLGKLSFRYLKGVSKYLKQTHLTALMGFQEKSLVKVAS